MVVFPACIRPLLVALVFLPLHCGGAPERASPPVAASLTKSDPGPFILVGGEWTEEGYQPVREDGHLLLRLESWPASGILEVEFRGMQAVTAGDHAFLAVYDGRGIDEPARYFEDFRENHFRLNVHWRGARGAMKAVVNCADAHDRLQARAVWPKGITRDFSSEPTGAGVVWNPDSWHTLRLEWSPRDMTVFVDDVKVWETALALDYSPVEPRLWLGSAPGHGAKYRNHCPGIVFRNFQLAAHSREKVSAFATGGGR